MAENRYGTGAIQSPPDERDLMASAATLDLLGADPPPDHYLISRRPPLRDQGWTPQCVAYSTAYEQAHNDRDDFGRWIDFNEQAFFTSIGGGPGGAVARYALDRLIAHGYPRSGDKPVPDRHKIAAYVRVEQTKAAIKAAIYRTRGVLICGPWWDSWSRPYGDKATVPAPSGNSNGHEWWAPGYDDVGVIGQNSWGDQWGNRGLFRVPWYYVINYMWEVWQTLDEERLRKITRVKIPNVGVEVRTKGVLGDDGKMDGTRWGVTRQRGIVRIRDSRVVVEPYDRVFRFGGFRDGARHGIGNHPRSWARVSINGVWRSVARPLVRLVTVTR